MKKEVSPRLIIASVIVVMAVVMTIYWKRLIPPRDLGGGLGPPPSGPPLAPPPPKGDPNLEVEAILGYGIPQHQDGYAWEARFAYPSGLVWAEDELLYVADAGNHCVRVARRGEVSEFGEVETVAGQASAGTMGDWKDGPVEEARFDAPMGVVLAPNGDLVVADTGNHVIRRVKLGSEVTTIAGWPREAGLVDGGSESSQLDRPTGLAWDDKGRLYIADSGNGAIRRLLPDGSLETVAGGESGLVTPMGLAWSGRHGLVVADPGAHGMWMVSEEGGVREVPVMHADEAMAVAMVPSTSDPFVRQVPIGAGLTRHRVEPATLSDPAQGSERLVSPTVVVASGDPDVVWVADAATACLYLVDVASGELTLKVGVYLHPSSPGNRVKGKGSEATIGRPLGLVRVGGKLYVADSTNHRIARVQREEALTPPPEGPQSSQG